MPKGLTTEEAFRDIARAALRHARGDHAFVSFSDSRETTLRFANNQVVQHVSVRSPGLSVQVAMGRQTGRASTSRLDAASVREVVRQAEAIAQLTPADPEYLPPLPRQDYLSVPAFRAATAAARPMDLAEFTRPVLAGCVAEELTGAGIMTANTAVRGVAASSGLFGFEETTSADFSLTASTSDSSGWCFNAHRDIKSLGIAERALRAIDKAIVSRDPRELPPGRYPVILEPAAVAGILGPFLWALSAKNYYRGNSPFSGKLGMRLLDERLSVRSDPRHPDLLGSRFTGEGLSTTQQTWIDNGVLARLWYDRFTAQQHGVEPNDGPGAAILRFSGPLAPTLDDLIAQTPRAILVTNFWYIRSVNPRDLTMTGMTRDGTFLVEDGKIVAGLRNFRWHESPLRCFARVDAATPPMEAVTLERGKMLLPAMLLPEFYFSSATRF